MTLKPLYAIGLYSDRQYTPYYFEVRLNKMFVLQKKAFS